MEVKELNERKKDFQTKINKSIRSQSVNIYANKYIKCKLTSYDSELIEKQLKYNS